MVNYFFVKTFRAAAFSSKTRRTSNSSFVSSTLTSMEDRKSPLPSEESEVSEEEWLPSSLLRPDSTETPELEK